MIGNSRKTCMVFCSGCDHPLHDPVFLQRAAPAAEGSGNLHPGPLKEAPDHHLPDIGVPVFAPIEQRWWWFRIPLADVHDSENTQL